jgi:hypothetical protein
MDGEEAKEGRVLGTVHNAGESLEFRAGGELVATVGVRDMDTTQELLLFAQVQLLSQVLQHLSVIATVDAASAKALIEMRQAAAGAAAAQQSPDEMMDKVLSRVQAIMGAGAVPKTPPTATKRAPHVAP